MPSYYSQTRGPSLSVLAFQWFAWLRKSCVEKQTWAPLVILSLCFDQFMNVSIIIYQFINFVKKTWVHRRLKACKRAPHTHKQYKYKNKLTKRQYIQLHRHKIQSRTNNYLAKVIVNYSRRKWRRADRNAILFDSCKM